MEFTAQEWPVVPTVIIESKPVQVLLLGCGPSLEKFEVPDGALIAGVNRSWRHCPLHLQIIGNAEHQKDWDRHTPGFIYDCSESPDVPDSMAGDRVCRIPWKSKTIPAKPGFSRDVKKGVYPGGVLFMALQILDSLDVKRICIAGLDWEGTHAYEDRPRARNMEFTQTIQFRVAKERCRAQIVNLNPDSKCRVFDFGIWEDPIMSCSLVMFSVGLNVGALLGRL